jgi:hypothetical protein
LVALWLLASCSAPPVAPAEGKFAVVYNPASSKCFLKRGAQILPLQSDGDIDRAADAARKWPEKKLVLTHSSDAPYKCVGAAIIVVQKANKPFGFTAEPAPSSEKN